jgi:hypothetical protein
MCKAQQTNFKYSLYILISTAVLIVNTTITNLFEQIEQSYTWYLVIKSS